MLMAQAATMYQPVQIAAVPQNQAMSRLGGGVVGYGSSSGYGGGYGHQSCCYCPTKRKDDSDLFTTLLSLGGLALGGLALLLTLLLNTAIGRRRRRRSLPASHVGYQATGE
jgi:hypothetical protein